MRRQQLKSKTNGFVLLTMSASVVVLLGMVGLALDLGRTFVVKNEAQAFTDAAALAAVTKLNGTSGGITKAKAAVTGSVNSWNFASQAFTSVTTEFSTDKITWSTDPASATEIKYVRVIAPSNSVVMTLLRMPLTFLRGANAPTSITVAARSIAGIIIPTSFTQGVFPFAPIAHDITSPCPGAGCGADFGYHKGDDLTLLWPSSVGSNGNAKMNNLCISDRNDAALQAIQNGTTSDRGYIQDTSASAIEAAIEDDHMDYTVTLGLAVMRSGGIKTTDVYQSLENRVAQDTDPTTDNYDTYVANHNSTGTPLRRVVIVPIVRGATDADAIVLGFAYVFLPSSQPHSPNDAKCATYIGSASLPSGNLSNGANILRMSE